MEHNNELTLEYIFELLTEKKEIYYNINNITHIIDLYMTNYNINISINNLLNLLLIACNIKNNLLNNIDIDIYKKNNNIIIDNNISEININILIKFFNINLIIFNKNKEIKYYKNDIELSFIIIKEIENSYQLVLLNNNYKFNNNHPLISDLIYKYDIIEYNSEKKKTILKMISLDKLSIFNNLSLKNK